MDMGGFLHTIHSLFFSAFKVFIRTASKEEKPLRTLFPLQVHQSNESQRRVI